MILSSAFLDGLILYYDDRFACTSHKKNVFEFEILDANTSRFAPCRIRLKMCVNMKEQAQMHYFGTIRAIPIPVLE